jgi:2-keto-3-deoxy-L-rhamnonate aldolase RhmA
MTNSPLDGGALRAQHGKHVERGFRFVAIGSDAAVLAVALGEAFAAVRKSI